MKKALVLGAGGFIGSHLVKFLKHEGFWVRGADLKQPAFSASQADEFMQGDLRNQQFCDSVLNMYFDEIYQLAADMGGAGYIFTGENDANVMHNSALININILERVAIHKVGKIFYSSSACIYPEFNQIDPKNPTTAEASAYPAQPDSEYGWEKLFSERLYLAFHRNYGIDVKIARYHNVFGPEGTWNDGKEKAPAALCRKVAQAADDTHIDVWGDGIQTRSFLYIDECLLAMRKFMDLPDFTGPLNIGSNQMISINDLAKMVFEISGKTLSINHIPGPQGVRGRVSDNTLIKEKLNWAPSQDLKIGMTKTYNWINQQANS